MARGSKNVSFYLIDGNLEGRIKCTIGRWVGIVYKSPRTSLNKFTDLDYNYLQQAGVYFLLNNNTDDKSVYIGQAGVRKNKKGVLSRVQEPHTSIPDWTDAVILTTKDNSMGLDDISYLEHNLCKMALDAGQYQVTNGNDPNPGFITEERGDELEEFIEGIKIIMELLGYKVFTPVSPQNINVDYDESVLYMKYGQGEATGKRADDGFVVLKGSTVNPGTTQSCHKSVLKAREEYTDKISDTYEITSDITFLSPSAAASFVGGATLNGLTSWHDSDGRTLKDIEG